MMIIIVWRKMLNPLLRPVVDTVNRGSRFSGNQLHERLRSSYLARGDCEMDQVKLAQVDNQFIATGWWRGPLGNRQLPVYWQLEVVRK